MELAITITVVVIILSILVGYSLFKGGKEIENNSIKMAGIYWLLITTISIIMLLITYSNTMKLSGELKEEKEEEAKTETVLEDGLDNNVVGTFADVEVNDAATVINLDSVPETIKQDAAMLKEYIDSLKMVD